MTSGSGARERAPGAAAIPEPSREPALAVELDNPLPEQLRVGAGTAVFLKGRCASPAGTRVRQLDIVAGGAVHELMAHGIPIYAMGSPDAWWGIVPFERVPKPRAVPLTLRARLDGGDEARAELGTVRLEPGRADARERDWNPAVASDRPSIAICMATFEPPLDLFERQIDSIRDQTHRSWFCVISDDCSRPERLAAMRRILGGDPRFRLVPSRRRRGFYGNFERALGLVPEPVDYVGLADQDDRWYPEKLEVLVAALASGATLAYSDTRVVDRSGAVVSDTYWRYRRNNPNDLTSLLITNAITGAAALFRRELLEDVLPFPPPHGDIFHDHWVALVAMATGEVRYVDRPLYEYVQHPRAAIGYVNANAGRGRWGGRLADLGMRIVRLGWRIVRPVGETRYFENYCRLALEARVLELRCGRRMSPRARRGVQRILACDSSLLGAAWLALRSLRPLAGANETMGMERGLLAGIMWRRIAGWRARARRARRQR